MFFPKLRRVCAVAATVLLLAGCSGGGDAGGDKTQDVNADTKAKLNISIWDKNQLPSLNKMIEGFNKKYPKIEVKPSVEDYDNYWLKMRTQAESDNLPDVFWMNGPNFQLYASNGQLAPLEELAKNKQVDKGKYPEALIDLYTYDNKLYGVPKDFDTIGVWYNKKLLKEAGVDEPKDNWTWDEFHDAAVKAGEHFKDKGIHGVVTNIVGSGQTSYYNTVPAAGGSILKDGKSGYDSPETIEGLQLWADLIHDGGMPQTKMMSTTWPIDIFSSGKAAMLWDGSWVAGPLKDKLGDDADNYDVAYLPKVKNMSTVIHGMSWAVSSKTKQMAAAQALAAYLGSEEAQLVDAQMGTAIPAYEGTQDEWLKVAPDWNLKSFIDSAENNSVPYPVSKNTSAWNEKENEILVPAFDAGGSMEDAAKKLASEMNDLLAKEK
ncbi:sugar ABC transporter substrate-binding protein [Gleimia hominis]|uniref:Sugar ABC transporter substrate-binding protein n=1 Tax=Gleimia hominis TaxID=595468 RepID=A0ABU3IAT6_9ACTO|nr:sugar ABC transporter substrate-binding protein [Gleimia hominis]MDT3766612.1 sugar ABC transporter substrate-binding protein [Gleimia hominis]